MLMWLLQSRHKAMWLGPLAGFAVGLVLAGGVSPFIAAGIATLQLMLQILLAAFLVLLGGVLIRTAHHWQKRTDEQTGLLREIRDTLHTFHVQAEMDAEEPRREAVHEEIAGRSRHLHMIRIPTDAPAQDSGESMRRQRTRRRASTDLRNPADVNR